MEGLIVTGLLLGVMLITIGCTLNVWHWKKPLFVKPLFDFSVNYPDRPAEPGAWFWREDDKMEWIKVIVVLGPTSGLVCHELRMGGSSTVPYENWWGQWTREIVAGG